MIRNIGVTFKITVHYNAETIVDAKQKAIKEYGEDIEIIRVED